MKYSSAKCSSLLKVAVFAGFTFFYTATLHGQVKNMVEQFSIQQAKVD